MILRSATTLLLLAAAALVRGQLYPSGHLATRGGGTVQGCDTSLHVGFTSELTGPYSYVFSPVVEPGVTTVLGSQWSYYTTDLYQSSGDADLPVGFPGAGDYPVCLTVNAFDPVSQQPCSSVTCDLFHPLADSSCAALVADFTIASIDGQTVTFANESSFTVAIEQAYWSFGDGSATAQAAASHEFIGAGPFEVCLSVIGPAPVHCSATVCKWLYLGPAGLDCDAVLDQGYLLLQQDDLVGVLDTSSTFGMNTDVTWDFGDGAIAHGSVAVHAYAPGSFELCGTVRLWGPLTQDTCISTLCRTVDAYAAAAIGEEESGEALRVWPVPFTDHLTFAGLLPGIADIDVLDACGRLVYGGPSHPSGPFLTLDLISLEPGPYVIRCAQGDLVRVAKALKE